MNMNIGIKYVWPMSGTSLVGTWGNTTLISVLCQIIYKAYTCHIPAQNQYWAYYQYQAGLKHLKDSKYQSETGTNFF
jgi:hypothetical protein